MPRRRIRRTDGSSRQQKMWAAQRKPGMGGVMPFGPSQRGGATTVVGRPGGGGQGQVRIEHVTLYAVEAQTIAAGGGTVQWFRRGGPPTEQRGFDSLATALDGGAVGDIPIDVTGRIIVHLGWRWETFRCKGDLTITRTREGVATTRTYDLGAIRSTEPMPTTLPGWAVRAGDTISIGLPNDSGEAQELAEAEMVLDVTELSAAATPLFQGGVIVAYGSEDGMLSTCTDGGTGWRYLQVASSDSTDRSAVDFDDSGWDVGQTAFGQASSDIADDMCFNTVWERGTRLWVRRADIPHRPDGYRVTVYHDDDALVYWNGTLVATFSGSGRDSVEIGSANIVAGDQTVAIRVTDTSPTTGTARMAALDVLIESLAAT